MQTNKCSTGRGGETGWRKMMKTDRPKQTQDEERKKQTGIEMVWGWWRGRRDDRDTHSQRGMGKSKTLSSSDCSLMAAVLKGRLPVCDGIHASLCISPPPPDSSVASPSLTALSSSQTHYFDKSFLHLFSSFSSLHPSPHLSPLSVSAITTSTLFTSLICCLNLLSFPPLFRTVNVNKQGVSSRNWILVGWFARFLPTVLVY